MKYSVLVLYCFKIYILHLVFLAFNSSDLSAAESESLSGQVRIEHGEIILPVESGGFARAYLVIWNGTGEFVYVTSVIDGQTNQPLEVVRHGNDSKIEFERTSMPMLVPPRAEILMKESGVHVIMRNLVKPRLDLTHPIIVQFQKNAPQTINARVLSAGSTPTDHHHGFRDQH